MDDEVLSNLGTRLQLNFSALTEKKSDSAPASLPISSIL